MVVVIGGGVWVGVEVVSLLVVGVGSFGSEVGSRRVDILPLYTLTTTATAITALAQALTH